MVPQDDAGDVSQFATSPAEHGEGYDWDAIAEQAETAYRRAIDGDYPTARDAYADLRSELYITYRGNRGIELNKSHFDKLADVLYHECGWEAWEIDSRLKHYEGIEEHDWK